MYQEPLPKRLVKFCYRLLIRNTAVFVTECLYGGVWNLRDKCKKDLNKNIFLRKIYFAYLRRFGAWIGLGAEFDSIPILPHGFQGIFISNSAKIGKNVVIFHQVTIGSNTLKDSSNYGAPIIQDNVYIGCGAKLIGNICIGKNSRIGANCVVVKDVPENSVTVIRSVESIIKEDYLDNKFIANSR